MCTIENEKKYLDLLAAMQLSINESLSPCLYLKMSKSFNAPALEELIELYGSWPKIKEEIETTINKKYKQRISAPDSSLMILRKVSKQEAIKALKLYKKNQGDIITLPKYEYWRKQQKFNLPTAYQIKEVFGTWGNVCRVAGLKARIRYTKPQILNYLKAAKKYYDKVPTMEEYYQWAIINKAPTVRTIAKHYGSWGNAMRSLLYDDEKI